MEKGEYMIYMLDIAAYIRRTTFLAYTMISSVPVQ